MTISIYGQSLALFTDLYEITMAYGYWKRQMADDGAVFHLSFRKKPFQGGFTVAAGLESIIEYLKNWHFDHSDIDYLATLKGATGQPLFEEGFLRYLSELKFTCDIDAVVEGEIVFPYEPLVRVRGPIIQAQLLESALLNLINFPTLIATKAARIRLAAGEDQILEFGVRRAQGIDGGLTASRATYIGGCNATSNTLAGKIFGIPVAGTHAHSWIMAFESEQEAFQSYAEALPDNCVFLVDTYDSIQGVHHAIKAGKWLKANGYPFLGIRLDSGDINYLSIESRKLLDEAGFEEAHIFASNELCEELIADLKRQGAKVAVWGVGTKMVTADGQSALDGVYKLSAHKKAGARSWRYCFKLSERMSKISDPGILQIRRFTDKEQGYIADAIYDVSSDFSNGCHIVDPLDTTRSRRVEPNVDSRDLLVPIFRGGELVYQLPTLDTIRSYAQKELSRFDGGIKRFYNPHSYPVGMERSFYELKCDLIESAKSEVERARIANR